MAVGGAEVAAVEREHLGFGLLEGGPRPVLQHPRELEGGEREMVGVKHFYNALVMLSLGLQNYTNLIKIPKFSRNPCLGIRYVLLIPS